MKTKLLNDLEVITCQLALTVSTWDNRLKSFKT